MPVKRRPIGRSLPGEIWKPVKGHEDYYEISNKGRMRTTPRLVGESEAEGYLCANLPSDFMGYGQSRGLAPEINTYRVPIHRIVAMTFLGKPKPKQTQINHKDGNKLNNQMENLEFCTPGQNLKHAYDTGLMPREKKFCKLSLENYEEMKALYATGEWTYDRLAVRFQCSQTHVGYVLNRRRILALRKRRKNK